MTTYFPDSEAMGTTVEESVRIVSFTVPEATYLRLSRVANRAYTSRDEVARAALYAGLEKAELNERSGTRIAEAVREMMEDSR